MREIAKEFLPLNKNNCRHFLLHNWRSMRDKGIHEGINDIKTFEYLNENKSNSFREVIPKVMRGVIPLTLLDLNCRVNRCIFFRNKKEKNGTSCFKIFAKYQGIIKLKHNFQYLFVNE